MLYILHLADPYLSASETGQGPIFVTVAALESSGIRARGHAPQLLVLAIDGHERRRGGHVWSGTQHGAVRRSVFAMGAATIIGVCSGKLIVFSTNDEEFSSAAPKNASRKMREPHRCKTYQPAPSGITTVYLETS